MQTHNDNDAAETAWLVGVDVGGTKIEAVVSDDKASVTHTKKIPARPGAEFVLNDVVGVVRDLIDESGIVPAAVGIGIPGQVDSKTGEISNVVNLDVVSLSLGHDASELLGLPVHVENDVNAAAQGAAALLADDDKSVYGRFGKLWRGDADDLLSADGRDKIVFLNLGTGLAAGVLIGGVIQHGFSGALGEIGHIPVDPNGFPCSCGQTGCLETVASGGAVARLWPHANPPMPDLIAKASLGEPEAQHVLGMVMHAIGDTIQIAAQSYDPRLIIIGGGMAKTGQPLLDAISAELHARELHSGFITSLDLSARLRLSGANRPVGAIGAALAAGLACTPIPQVR